MSVLGPRTQSRATTLLIVAAVHGLILWGLWQVRMPIGQEVETFVSMLSFIAHAPSQPVNAPSMQGGNQAVAAKTKARAVSTNSTGQLLRGPPLPPAESVTAITPAAAPAGRIDWTAQLEAAARAELDEEAQARKQLRALTRRFEVDPDPRNPGLAPSRAYRWYGPGIHRIDTRGQLPVLLLNDRCVMLMFIIPFCRIGHIEIHGDLFDGAAAAHDERLATPGPNEVP